MSALKSISFAIGVASQKRDAHVQMVNRYKRALAFASEQMSQLQSYVQETSDKWLVSSQRGTSPELMCTHYQFMARLQDAIVLQTDVLSQAERDVQSAHKNYLEAEMRIASLELMKKKLQSDMDVKLSRREQKQTDEFAATRKLKVYETL
jgi:flagellar FliJ protein